MCLCIFLFDFRRSKSRTQTTSESTPLLPPIDEPTASGSASVVAAPPTRTPHMIPPLVNMSHPRPGSPLRPHLGHRWVSKHLRDFQHPFMPAATANTSAGVTTPAHATHAERTCTTDEAPFQTPTLPLLEICTRRRREDEVSVSTVQSDTHEVDIAPSVDVDLTASFDTITDFILHKTLEEGAESDGSFDEITIDEASMLSATGWAENTDRLLCYLWVFTGHSLAAMAAVLNFACDESELGPFKWLGGEDARARLLQLMDGADEHAFVYHDVLRLSKDEQRKDAARELASVEKQLGAAWQALRSDLMRTAMPDDKRWSSTLRSQLLDLEWTGLTWPGRDVIERPETREEIESFSVNAESVSEKAVRAGSGQSRFTAWLGRGRR